MTNVIIARDLKVGDSFDHHGTVRTVAEIAPFYKPNELWMKPACDVNSRLILCEDGYRLSIPDTMNVVKAVA